MISFFHDYDDTNYIDLLTFDLQEQLINMYKYVPHESWHIW